MKNKQTRWFAKNTMPILISFLFHSYPPIILRAQREQNRRSGSAPSEGPTRLNFVRSMFSFSTSTSTPTSTIQNEPNNQKTEKMKLVGGRNS